MRKKHNSGKLKIFLVFLLLMGIFAFVFVKFFYKNEAEKISENFKWETEKLFTDSRASNAEISSRSEAISWKNSSENISEKIVENNSENSQTIVENNSQKVSEKYPQDDASIYKFVSPEVAFDNPKYIPENLVNLKKSATITLAKNEQIRSDIVEPLQKMSEEFYEKFKKPMHVVSVYRSYDRQLTIATNNPQCVADGFCSNAGHSEHQSGLAIDFFEATSEEIFMKNPNNVKYHEWMDAHAHYYGFTQSYKNGREIDGYNVEPWHWRYVGVELATELKNANMTLSEWYKKNF